MAWMQMRFRKLSDYSNILAVHGCNSSTISLQHRCRCPVPFRLISTSSAALTNPLFKTTLNHWRSRHFTRQFGKKKQRDTGNSSQDFTANLSSFWLLLKFVCQATVNFPKLASMVWASDTGTRKNLILGMYLVQTFQRIIIQLFQQFADYFWERKGTWSQHITAN